MKIGDSCEEKFQIFQKDVIVFSEITGDKNPIHLDENYCKSSLFGKPIVHGFLGGSIFSKIIGMKFPGEGTIYLQQSMSFRKPMFVGEKYTAKVELIEILPEKNRARLTTIIFNNENKEVIVGDALIQNKNISC